MLQVAGIISELKYLFCAQFQSGLTVYQPSTDRSKAWTEAEPRSAWYDVMEAIRRGETVEHLNLLSGEVLIIGVNFRDLTFETEHSVFRAHDGKPVFNSRPIYFRRRSVELNGAGTQTLTYHIGWQGNVSPHPSSSNVERVMEVLSNGCP